MTWTKLSDDHLDRPAVLNVTRSARLLEVEALVWCNRLLTDGHIPRGALRRVTDAEDPQSDAAELVAAGLWSVEADGWVIVGFEQDQEAAVDVHARRDEWRRRQRRQRLHNLGDHSECDPKRCRVLLNVTPSVTRDSRVTHASVTASRPVPSRPQGRDGEGEAWASRPGSLGVAGRGPREREKPPSPRGLTITDTRKGQP